MPVESQLGVTKVEIAGKTGTMRRYFQTDLSASLRWPLKSLASAPTEPVSSLGSPPSSSPPDSDRFSLGLPGASPRRIVGALNAAPHVQKFREKTALTKWLCAAGERAP